MATVLKVITAFFLPPLATALQVGLTTHFFINVVLTLLGWLPGFLHALCLILSDAK